MALATLALQPSAAAAQTAPRCGADPLGGRPLYLRGSFNSWTASDSHQFRWACTHYELVTPLEGEQRFKLADEAWSADADFGRGAQPQQLALRGDEIQQTFHGTYRFTFTMHSAAAPQLQIESCPADAPLGATTLYLRGTMNNWAALDDYAFQYHCDAYYVNVKLDGQHEFKIGDAAWSAQTTFGHDAAQGLRAGSQSNLAAVFEGEHTLRLAWAGNRPQLDIGPKSFADARLAAVTHPVARSLHFDSRASAHKTPFGAVPAGTEVQYELTALPGVDRLTLVVEQRRLEGNQEVLAYTELARLPLHKTTVGQREHWSTRYRFDAAGVYGYWFEADIGGERYAYQNNAQAVFWTREKGSGGVGAVLARPAHLGAVRRFRQTVYAPDFQVPSWAQDAVYYYIFPDRFRNGNSQNDPQPGVSRYQNHSVERHAHWLEKPYKPGSGDGSDAVYNNDFFGGDLDGIIEKLDYIAGLGANTLYLTPIFQAASNHKYDTADYHRIDPAFGSNADFERLTREAQRRSMRVIIDTSLNHTGSDSLYFNRYGNFPAGGAFDGGRINPDSPYASWYTVKAEADTADAQYQGWVGVTDLPELNKAAPAWRAFAYGAPDSVMKRWLDRGAAGWRMDVAPWVSDDFWRGWRSAIKQHKGDALTVAETWFDASKYFLGDMFDSTMNYVFRDTVLAYAAGGKASALYANLEHLREAYPPQSWYALMNLLSSHDQPRSLHVLGWRNSSAEQERDRAAMQRAKARLRLAVFFQMTYPGAPAVYYGDEVGVTGGEDPYNRATYPWADLGGKPDMALRASFRDLIRLRHQQPILRRGTLDAPLLLDDHLIVLHRQLGDRHAIVASNNAEHPITVELSLPPQLKVQRWVDALGGTSVRAGTGQRLRLTVPAQFGVVLLSP